MTSGLHVALIGPGLVGKAFLTQFSEKAETYGWKLVAISNSRKMVLSEDINLGDWERELQSSTVKADLDLLSEFLVKFAASDGSKSVKVIIDSTADGTIGEYYPKWLASNINIVTPNKKPFTSDINLFYKLKELSRKVGKNNPKLPMLMHESTVGAGLPVINVLNQLVLTGDKIIKIEGIFSGSLSFLFNNFSTMSTNNPLGENIQFSDIIKLAKESGYTEPDPRDDLSGMDVARKLCILGRLMGLDISLSNIRVDSLVPEPLRSTSEFSDEEFMRRLPEYDRDFEALRERALHGGKVLRFIGEIDIDAHPMASVKLAEFESDHPFSNLKGSDNIVSFTTERFPKSLIIQGSGAGADVTAFGMMADLIRVQECN